MSELTLGGYMAKHERAAAFGGSDGQAYSVAVYVDAEPDLRGLYGAALLFVRWGDGQPVGHLETEYLAFGPTPDEALAPVLALTLEQVKAHLDQCVARAGQRA